MLVGPQASASERTAFAAKAQGAARRLHRPADLGALTCPTFVESGVAPRHVDLRPFVLSGKEIHIVPGGLTRVALHEGSLVVNSSQGGGTKDTWCWKSEAMLRDIVRAITPTPTLPRQGEGEEKEDAAGQSPPPCGGGSGWGYRRAIARRVRSVLSRTADSLYWLAHEIVDDGSACAPRHGLRGSRLAAARPASNAIRCRTAGASRVLAIDARPWTRRRDVLGPLECRREPVEAVGGTAQHGADATAMARPIPPP